MISTPIGLAGLGLAFWGWQTGLFWVGLLAGLGLELTRLVRQPWQFTQKDLDQIWNFCVVLFLASIVFAFLLGEGGNALADVARENSAAHRLEAFRKSAQTMVTILSWLPLSFLPILAAQALGNRTGMDWSTFSWWLRLQRSGADSELIPLPLHLIAVAVGFITVLHLFAEKLHALLVAFVGWTPKDLRRALILVQWPVGHRNEDPKGSVLAA